MLRTARPAEAVRLHGLIVCKVLKEEDAILEEAMFVHSTGALDESERKPARLVSVDSAMMTWHCTPVISTEPTVSIIMWDLLASPTLPQWIYIIAFCGVSGLLLLLRRSPSKPLKLSPRSVAILVLGDVGRSPRMMYHAESFAKLQFETFLVGYKGASLGASLGGSSQRPACCRF